MLLTLTKTHYVKNSEGGLITIGRLDIDGQFECWTLERASAALSDRRYELAMKYSERFNRWLPFLLGSNRARFIDIDAPGCILVGRTKGEDFVGESRSALEDLVAKIEPAMRRERVFVEIRREI